MSLSEQDCPSEIEPVVWKEHLAARVQRDITNLQGVNALAGRSQADAVAAPTASELLIMRERSNRLRTPASHGLTPTGSGLAGPRGL